MADNSLPEDPTFGFLRTIRDADTAIADATAQIETGEVVIARARKERNEAYARLVSTLGPPPDYPMPDEAPMKLDVRANPTRGY